MPAGRRPPRSRGERTAAPLNVVETLRYLWTQLTAMRTALVLLFVLALAAIPGSIFPQRPVSPVRVRDYAVANPTLYPWLDRLGLFDVYASPWFAAVYLLLFLSLAGCIIPRIGTHARTLRAGPPRTPKNLSRLPQAAAARVADPAPAVLDRAEEHLSAGGFRTRRFGDSVASERGQLREVGNIVFHLALLIGLVGVAWTALFGYKGDAIVVEGQAFSNNLTQYDDFSAGGAFRADQLTPFTIWVDSFEATFERGPVQRGAARVFSAKIRSQTLDLAEPRASVLEVNHPLDIGGTSVHLLGHGYAALVTVTDGEGRLAYSGPVVFLPQDGNFSSIGVVKAPDGRPQRLAFEGLFLPTAVVGQGGPQSVFPDALNPALFLNAWSGPPKVESGRPENVFSLDKEGLTQLKDPAGKPLAFRLSVGQTRKLPGGGAIRFDGWKRWTKLQVSHSPGVWWVVASVMVAVVGMCLSLFVQPRRLWVRAVETADGVRLEVGGLDRADGRAGLAEDVERLLAAARGDPVTVTTDPSDEPEESA